MDNKERIVSSQILKEEAERETGKSIIESNGGAGRYAMRDDSYKNSIDCIVKAVRSDDGKKESSYGKLEKKGKGKAILFGAIAVIACVVLILALTGGCDCLYRLY